MLTQEAVFLRKGVAIQVATCSYRTVRGYNVLCALCDEVAFWRDESSTNPDTEVFGRVTSVDAQEGAGMDWDDYLRDQAAHYRQLAESAEDPLIKQEHLELAAICEEVANHIEDRLPGG